MKAQGVPLLWHSDCMVVESTLAGCNEALRLRRLKKRVTLVSSSSSLGHEITVCLRPWMDPDSFPVLEPALRALLLGSRREGFLDLVKVTEGLEDLLLDAGVRLLYGAQPAAILKEGVAFAGKFGLRAITAKTVIDASVSGVLSRLAGRAPLRPPIATVGYAMFCDGAGAPPAELAFPDGKLLFHGPYAEFQLSLPLDPHSDFYDARLVTLAREATLKAVAALKRAGRLPKALRFVRGGDALFSGLALAKPFPLKPGGPAQGLAFSFNDADPLRPLRRGLGQALAAVLKAPVALECDTLVVGGGTSGMPAALAAARAGARTVLVEKHSDLGGTRTIGGVSVYWFGRRTPFLQSIDGAKTAASGSGLPLAMHYFELVQQARAEILLRCQAAGVLVEKGRVRGVVFATEDGLRAVKAHTVIDASGDGDLAAWAKAAYTWGAERDAMTMWFSFGKFVGAKAEASRHYHSVVDVRDALDMTRAMISARRRVGVYGVGDFPQSYLTPRESRHIQGRGGRVTYEGILRKQAFKDLCLVCRSNFDIKGIASSDLAMAGYVDADYRGNHDAAIPFSALLPKGLEGLLVIGKAYDASHDALALARMERDMIAMGGAAGLASAQALREGVPVAKISLKAFQKGLLKLGVLSNEDLKKHGRADARPPLPLGLQELLKIGARLDPARAGDPFEMARARCYLGDPAGLEPVLARIRALARNGLPMIVGSKHHHPDHGWTDEPCRLIAIASRTRDLRLIPVLEAVAAQVKPDPASSNAMFNYIYAVCYAAERLAHPKAMKALRTMAKLDCLRGRQLPTDADPRRTVDYVGERFAYLELCVGRAMARCGAAAGYRTLVRYVNDPRAFLALSARQELLDLSGKNFGGGTAAWGRWLKGRKLKVAAFRKALD
jgi:hypothetical protein